MSDDLPFYAHTPLQAGQVRILTIQPSPTRSAIVSCSLRTVWLSEACDGSSCGLVRDSGSGRSPGYDALSYCWSDGCLDTRYVLLDGALLGTTCSLQAALQHLRRTDRGRDVWIDALCIDQANDEEKGLQVPLMRTIYQQARGVVVWLGGATKVLGDMLGAWEREEEEAGEAVVMEDNRERSEMGEIGELDPKMNRMTVADHSTKNKDKDKEEGLELDSDASEDDWSDESDEGDGDDSGDDDDDSESDSGSDSDDDNDDDDGDSDSDSDDSYSAKETSNGALRELSRKPWFGRVWIVQEVCLARADRIVVVCGPHTLSWSTFIDRTADALSRSTAQHSEVDSTAQRDDLTRFHDEITRLNQARLLWQSTTVTSTPRLDGVDSSGAAACTLLRQLCHTRGRQCTVRSDQVYGILGICADIAPEAPSSSTSTFSQPTSSIPAVAFPVRYDEPTRQVFARSVAHCIAAERNLKVLGAIWRGEDAMELPRSFSWVPNWAEAPPPHPFTLFDAINQRPSFRAALDTLPMWSLTTSGQLSLQGAAACTVDLVSATRAGELRDVTSASELHTRALLWCSRVAKLAVRRRVGSSRFWRALCEDGRLTGAPAVSEGHLKAIVDWLRASEKRATKLPPVGELREALRAVVGGIYAACQGRVFFCSADGQQFGLAPELTEKGDKVVVFLGGETPFVVRRKAGRTKTYKKTKKETEVGSKKGQDGKPDEKDDREGQKGGGGREGKEFLLVGECFCTNIMDGEIFLSGKGTRTFGLL